MKLKSMRSRSQKKQRSGDSSSVVDEYTTGQYLRLTKKFAQATILSFWRQHKIASRVTALFLVAIMLFSIFYQQYEPARVAEGYEIGTLEHLLDDPIPYYSDLLTTDLETGNISFNTNYLPAQEIAGDNYTPKITASFSADNDHKITVNDPINNVGISMIPKYQLDDPLKKENMVVYPVVGKNAVKVYTLKGSGVKEDIILRSKPANDYLALKYSIELPDGLEIRMEDDGSAGVYGVGSGLLGNVVANGEEDQALLEKARKNGEKTKFLFRIPAPQVIEENHKISKSAVSWFTFDGNELTIHTEGLHGANYPLSIDPTIYVETAQKLMRGNNETNTDFDVDNELIQKSQTSGARIDTWNNNLDMNEGVWGHSTAVAGGYVYRTGGRTGTVAETKPDIADQVVSTQGSNSSSFTMSMPTTRPADDLYVAVMCHDGTGAVAPPSGGGWTEYSDDDEHAAYYKIGTDEGGGDEASSYTWTGSSEQWMGVIMRVTGFDSADAVSGTPGTVNSSGTPTFPATTPDDDTTLIIRSVGVDNDAPSTSGWVPTDHTKVASGTSSGSWGDCGYAVATMDNPPAASVSTGTASLGEMNDTYGGASIAINPEPVVGGTTETKDTVDWAKFNSSTLAIESPNPGAGVCTDWCTDSAYVLPDERHGHSMVAYNGYLYVMGGENDSSVRQSTVYIAKLGANGEPSLWHPTDTDPDNWDYWYTDTGLSGSTAKSYMSAVAYNNRMYVVGGQTNASAGGVTAVQQADILPNGRLGSWTTTGMQALPSGSGLHMQGVHIYNDVMYTIGGFDGVETSSANLSDEVWYSRLNSDGTMNAWQSSESYTTARANFGGSFSYIWGAYIYMGGGCSAVNGSGYCTTFESDMQLISINADGTLDKWTDLGSLDNTRIGYSLIGWQGGLYRLGGCNSVNTGTGECDGTLADVDYGVINPAGEVSTVNITDASGVGTCTGGSPYNCDLPPYGDDAGEGGQLLTMTVILNGYLYNIGGCIDYTCDGTNPSSDDDDVSGNISYVEVGSDGSLQAPSTCGGTSYGAWCVDSTNRINGTDGVAAGGVTVFNNRIYIVGGMVGPGSTDESTDIFYNSVNTDGSLAGAWSSVDMTSIGMTIDVAYTYAYARANPSAAGTTPGHLFIFGGCANITSGISCGTSSANYRTEVYKCNIGTSGAVSSCSTSGQTQIDSDPDTGGSQGLGIHSGTVYANYIYLVGGYSNTESDKDEIMIAKFDDNNNVVEQDGAGTSNWSESPNTLSIGRRRGWAFGYNGHIYSTGGYDSGSGTIPFIEWSKIDVSTGDIDPFITSSVTINQRWGLSMAVSNSYAYVVGGCDVGTSPTGCSSLEPSVQTFQLYNNDSGSVDDYTAQSDQTFTTDTDRWGASSIVYDGYLYVAGGCISATDCTNATNSVQYASISDADGSIGTWSAGGNLPADRAWGVLLEAGGTLYYVGGQNDTATNEQSTVYYTSGISSGNPTWNGTAASNGLPAARTKFGAVEWNDRLYVVGGLDGSASETNTVYISPQQSSGGNISSAWTSNTDVPDVARQGGAVTAYANNLYLFGGFDGTNYLSDSQFAQINTDGTVDAWTFSAALQGPIREGIALSANGYIYIVGGRTAASTCSPKTIIVPISANTTIASGNEPTGVGEWYETNVRYTGDRYGAAVAYSDGNIYTMGGGCTAPLSTNRHYESSVNSQPQVAIYSRMIDTDTDVFPNSWLLNGLDNSIGARWQVRYRSMHDLDGIVNPSEDCGTSATMPVMTTWGQDTNFGDVTLGDVEPYTPKNSTGGDINCARYFYFFISIDASKTFGYPEDVNRGPTIADLSLFFTSDPNKRLRHGKTFTGGEQQPLDTPCRQSVDSDCPLP